MSFHFYTMFVSYPEIHNVYAFWSHSYTMYVSYFVIHNVYVFSFLHNVRVLSGDV